MTVSDVISRRPKFTAGLPPLDTVNGATALRIRFVAEPASGVIPLWTLTDPYRRSAVAEELPPERLFGLAKGELAATDELHFLFLPSGAATPIEWQRRAEQWMNEPSQVAETTTIDLAVQSDRVLWRPGRAVLFGNADRLAELRAGLVEFSFHEGELRNLELELEADWPRAESDVPLVHDVDRRALADCGHISEMSQRTALRRIRFTRLAPRLEKASIRLAGPTRRMVAELASQADVVDRLESVDDRLEVFENLYELANDRRADFQYFRLEYRLEAWIILILVIEVLLMMLEIWWA